MRVWMSNLICFTVLTTSLPDYCTLTYKIRQHDRWSTAPVTEKLRWGRENIIFACHLVYF